MEKGGKGADEKKEAKGDAGFTATSLTLQGGSWLGSEGSTTAEGSRPEGNSGAAARDLWWEKRGGGGRLQGGGVNGEG